MIYFVNGNARVLFSEKSLENHIAQVKESVNCKGYGYNSKKAIA